MYICIYIIYIYVYIYIYMVIHDSRHTEYSSLTDERVPKCMSCHKAIYSYILNIFVFIFILNLFIYIYLFE